jgi:DNA-binding Lrp family transcriptional regulator
MIVASMTEKLSENAKKMYALLQELAVAQGTPQRIELSYSALMKATGRSLTTVKYRLKELEYHGWLEIRHRYEGARIKRNWYVLKH